MYVCGFLCETLYNNCAKHNSVPHEFQRNVPLIECDTGYHTAVSTHTHTQSHTKKKRTHTQTHTYTQTHTHRGLQAFCRASNPRFYVYHHRAHSRQPDNILRQYMEKRPMLAPTSSTSPPPACFVMMFHFTCTQLCEDL